MYILNMKKNINILFANNTNEVKYCKIIKILNKLFKKVIAYSQKMNVVMLTVYPI